MGASSGSTSRQSGGYVFLPGSPIRVAKDGWPVSDDPISLRAPASASGRPLPLPEYSMTS